MAFKDYAVIVDFSGLSEREHLKTARISQHGVRPLHELMQSTQFGYQLIPWAQVKMIGIGQQDAHAEVVGKIAL